MIELSFGVTYNDVAHIGKKLLVFVCVTFCVTVVPLNVKNFR